MSVRQLAVSDHRGVDCRQPRGCGVDLGLAFGGVGLIVQALAVDVGQVYCVIVGDYQAPDAAPGQKLSVPRTESSDTDYER